MPLGLRIPIDVADSARIHYRLFQSKLEKQGGQGSGDDLHRRTDYLHHYYRHADASHEFIVTAARHENTSRLQFSPLPKSNVINNSVTLIYISLRKLFSLIL